MTNAQVERLHLLIEEASEVIKAATKALRHGYSKRNPMNPSLCDNRYELEEEMGDLRAAMLLLCRAGDVKKKNIHDWAKHKLESYKRGDYLYYNGGK